MLNKAKSETAKGPRHDPAVPLEGFEAPSLSHDYGLCGSCLRATDCTFPRDAGHPVRSCDEFDGGRPRRKTKGPQVLAAPAPGFCEEATERLDARGLCRTCARLSGCTFPRPADGVWHCEEFE